MPEPETAAAILERCRAGDRQAFRELIQTHQDQVYGLCTALVGGAGRDATWLTFVRINQELSGLFPRRRGLVWILKIAAAVCAQREIEPQPAPLPVRPGAVLSPLAERLRQAWPLLPPAQRSALALAAWVGLAEADIAVVVGLPASAVSARLQEGRLRLAEAARDLPSAGDVDETLRRLAPVASRELVDQIMCRLPPARANRRRWWLGGAALAAAGIVFWLAGALSVGEGSGAQRSVRSSESWRAVAAPGHAQPDADRTAAAEEEAPSPAGATGGRGELAAPWRGASQPRVTLVLFSDYQCPFCVVFHRVVLQAAARYPNVLRLEMRQDPLPTHGQAELAAEAALAAHEQGRFWEMHDQLIAQDLGLDRPALEAYAQRAGLDLAGFRAALDGHRFRRAVARDVRLAAGLGITGVPTLVVGGGAAPERLSGARGLEEITAAVERVLSRRP